ncbi:MAG: hypothetical protein J6B62_03875 [Bacteroidales bacterium]|nr:hypothetical protein [Bacteroidales bacterium]
MKRNIFLAAGAVLVAAAVSVFVYVKNENYSMNELFNANVEVLARSESGGFGPQCSKTGSSGTNRMKLCSDCNGPFGDYAMDVVAYCQN